MATIETGAAVLAVEEQEAEAGDRATSLAYVFARLPVKRVSQPHLNPHRKIIGGLGLTEGRVEVPALRAWRGTRRHMLKYQFIGTQ